MRRLVVAAMLVGTLLALAGCGTAVPDIKGMTVAQATAAIRTAGFEVGKVTYDEEASGTIGTVIAQNPVGGGRAKVGSLVILTVAGPPPVATPDLSGLSKATAEAALVAVGLKLGGVTESYDASIPAGVVATQTPRPGAEAPRSSLVTLIMSMGPEPVAIPQVVGKTQADAVKLFETAGFKVKIEQKADKTKKGLVFAQKPASGKAPPNTTVVISVSTGVEMVRVPNLRGKWYDVAEAALRKLGLRYREKINAEGLGPTGGVGVAEVYRQSPSAGTLVPRGTMVTIWFQIYE